MAEGGKSEWLLVKRGLYYRPNNCGYTGIRDHAGLYSEDEARSSVGDGASGVKMIRLADAPEFSEACFQDLALAHLKKKLDEAADAIERMQSGPTPPSPESGVERAAQVADQFERECLPNAIWDCASHHGGLAAKEIAIRIRALSAPAPQAGVSGTAPADTASQ